MFSKILVPVDIDYPNTAARVYRMAVDTAAYMLIARIYSSIKAT